ncbi:MAG: transposase [Synergistaceae bacterium]|nr:transposase [Synergistaceae bacterium]
MTSTYWDKRCEAISPFLWLPSVKVLDGIKESEANFEDVTPLKGTWFESQMYSLPYSQHCRKSERKECSQARRTRKIRIYPDAKQREILMHWMRAARYVYNEATEYVAKSGKTEWLTVKAVILKNLPDWMEEVPYQIKAIAVRDACITFHNAGGPKFRARRSSKQSLFVPKASASRRGVYTRYLGKMDYAEELPEVIGDCRVILDGGRWFVSVPVSVIEYEEMTGKVAAVDPGFRSFVTFYGLDSCGKAGRGAFSRIHSLCGYLDDLNARMSGVSHRQRYKMRKAADRLRWRIRNLLEELQHKTALFLVKNFDVIALPEFRAEDFGSGSLREIAGNAHTVFQEFLRAKAREYGVKVIVQDESGTSGTCSWNGEMRTAGRYIRDGVVTLDRDYNGARGIFLRALRESAIPAPV